MREIDINNYFIIQGKIKTQITVVANYCRKEKGEKASKGGDIKGWEDFRNCTKYGKWWKGILTVKHEQRLKSVWLI